MAHLEGTFTSDRLAALTGSARRSRLRLRLRRRSRERLRDPAGRRRREGLRVGDRRRRRLPLGLRLPERLPAAAALGLAPGITLRLLLLGGCEQSEIRSSCRTARQ